MVRFDPERESAEQVAGALGWPFVDLESYSISCGILKKISAELSCRTRAVPMVFNAHRAVLVVDDPFEGLYLSLHPELLGRTLGDDVEIALTTRRGLDAALHRRITLVKD